MNETDFPPLPDPDFLLDSGRLRCYYGGTVANLLAEERERWRRVADAAQAVTIGGKDRIANFVVPSHLMAALALALDEGPNK